MPVPVPTPRAVVRLVGSVLGSPLGTARTLAVAALNTTRSGIVDLARPDRSLRQADAVRRWGTSLPGALAAAAAVAPGAVAVVDDAGSRTYAELATRTHRLAAALADLGLSERDRVGVLCRNSALMVETVLALAELGADAVLLNTGSGAEQTARVLAAQRVRLVVADGEFGPMLADATAGAPGSVEVVTAWPEPGTDASGRSVDGLIEATRADRRLARPTRAGRLIVLTSGTTGTPKGAARPEPSALTAMVALTGLLSRLPLRARTPTLIPAPMFHTWGLAGLQLSLAGRSTIVLARRFDPEAALALTAEHGARQMFAVPVMLARILELPAATRAAYDTSALRLVASSGSALPTATVTGFLAAFGDVLYNLYGSTEVSWVGIATPRELRAHPATAGRPPLGTRVAILDAAGRPVDDGEVGRIFVGNPMLFDGYTDAGTGSRETRDGLMSTGDLGHLDAAGLLFVDGREDDMVVSGGENVFPREVEDVLTASPDIREAAVVGVPDQLWGHRLAAFVVPVPGAVLDADGVRALVRERLARHAVPRDVTFLRELPRTATGKVLARELRELRGP
jgi:acyl-CoA synthetase (AMP-forming)/AMP-acid ligase II